MKEIDNNLDEEIRLWQEKLFSRSIRRTRKLARIEALMGSTMGQQCLEMSSGDGIISAHLRGLGGSWKAILSVDQEKLPFDDQSFDVVVITDALKGMTAADIFIRECHRILKTDGWVVISETCRRPASLVALLQRLFNVTPVAKGQKRNGYTEHELYSILKDGFDVPKTTTYSNGLLEAAATVGDFFQKLVIDPPYWQVPKNPGKDLLHRYRRLNTLAGLTYPLLWVLSVFEFLPGHRLLVKSRRRPWRPRKIPKLVDGRSIAEAAINTKIGTAAPF